MSIQLGGGEITCETFANVMFMSSEFNNTRRLCVDVSSNVIRSPTRNHSNEAIDRFNSTVLYLTSLPLTYHTFDGIRFIDTGKFFRTCSSLKFKSVTPIFKQPARMELYSVILISNGSPTARKCSENTKHRVSAGRLLVHRLATVQFWNKLTLPEMHDQRCFTSVNGAITEAACRLCEFSLIAYGARVLDCIESTMLTCAHCPYKSITAYIFGIDGSLIVTLKMVVHRNKKHCC